MHPLKHFVRNRIYRLRQVMGIERALILGGQVASQTCRVRQTAGSLAEVEFGVFSQWGEDGIIDWLIERLAVGNQTFIEFGIEDFRESNCRFLLMNRNWRGFVIDGDEGNLAALRGDAISYKHDIAGVAAFVTAENINALLSLSGFEGTLGILSVDLDGVDWWVLKAITREADIVIVEYNDFFGDLPVTVPYDPGFSRGAAHWSNVYWGASLSAFRHLLEPRGYILAGTNSVGTNAFFVHARHETALRGALKSFRAFPCRIRDTRTADGKVALKRYEEFLDAAGNLPLMRVDTNETVALADVARTSRASLGAPA